MSALLNARRRKAHPNGWGKPSIKDCVLDLARRYSIQNNVTSALEWNALIHRVGGKLYGNERNHNLYNLLLPRRGGYYGNRDADYEIVVQGSWGRMPQSKEELDADDAQRRYAEETAEQEEELRLKRVAHLPELGDLGPELDPANPDPRAHIYFLIKTGTVVYVGETSRLGNRIRAHNKDKTKSFNSFKAIEAPLDVRERQALERLYIEKFTPEYNKN